jgi:hypothetical protein
MVSADQNPNGISSFSPVLLDAIGLRRVDGRKIKSTLIRSESMQPLQKSLQKGLFLNWRDCWGQAPHGSGIVVIEFIGFFCLSFVQAFDP